MSTPLVEIRQALMVSQAEFLALLARFQPETLHQQIDNEPWTPAVILLHMCEAREHYTADVGRLLASNFKARVGRATDDPQRMTEIAAAATGVRLADSGRKMASKSTIGGTTTVSGFPPASAALRLSSARLPLRVPSFFA